MNRVHPQSKRLQRECSGASTLALAIVCGLFSLSACNPNVAQDNFKVALKFAVGDDYVSEYVERIKTQVAVPRGDGNSSAPCGVSSERRVGSKLTILAGNPERTHIRAKYTSVGLRVTPIPANAGAPTDFFYSETDATSEGRLLDDFSAVALLGAVVVFEIDSRGQVSEVPPLRGLLRDQIGVHTDEASNRILKNLDRLMDGDYSIACLSPLWPIFPQADIKPGTSWEQEMSLEGTWRITYTVTEASDDGMCLIAVGELRQDPEAPGTDSDVQVTQSSLRGTVEYDLGGPPDIDAEFHLHWRSRSLVDTVVVQSEFDVVRTFRFKIS